MQLDPTQTPNTTAMLNCWHEIYTHVLAGNKGALKLAMEAYREMLGVGARDWHYRRMMRSVNVLTEPQIRQRLKMIEHRIADRWRFRRIKQR